MEVALQELDETLYWLDLLIEAGIMPAKRLGPLKQEIDELIAIIISSLQTVKQRRRRKHG